MSLLLTRLLATASLQDIALNALAGVRGDAAGLQAKLAALQGELDSSNGARREAAAQLDAAQRRIQRWVHVTGMQWNMLGLCGSRLLLPEMLA